MAEREIVIAFILVLIMLLIVIVEAIIYDVIIFPRLDGYDNLLQQIKDKLKRGSEKR